MQMASPDGTYDVQLSIRSLLHFTHNVYYILHSMFIHQLTFPPMTKNTHTKSNLIWCWRMSKAYSVLTAFFKHGIGLLYLSYITVWTEWPNKNADPFLHRSSQTPFSGQPHDQWQQTLASTQTYVYLLGIWMVNLSFQHQNLNTI